jgi:hypothetical protein
MTELLVARNQQRKKYYRINHVYYILYCLLFISSKLTNVWQYGG